MADEQEGGEEETKPELEIPKMPMKIDPPEYIAIQQSLVPFFEDITDEQRDRRKFDEQRVEETNLYAQRIEEKLNAEILKRKEADAALDKLAQTRLETVQEALVHQMQVNFKELKKDIEAAKERLEETETKLIEVREKNERELKACKLELVERLDRIQAGMRVESKTRREEDEKTAKHLAAEIALLKDAVRKEKIVREDENKLIVQRLEVLEHEEIKAGERAQLKIFEQLRELRRVLQLEKEARIAEEDKVRVVLEEYQVALQQGLKIVNKSDYDKEVDDS
uniref:Uncharacterized protein n=1 Tax=Hanusia phi TaxID=3032 RepID=A0A7S0EYJ3_9CRYP|mmetsp:Transcript_34288/g.77233  ORF Transcript_34288/g.77233 Transcript_34288/m.77233 type:complete len:281 (+) Transcript_34288:259-1101(+)